MGRIASFYGFSEDNERIIRIAKIIIGFPVSLMICALISLIGVLMLRKGLSYPVPVPEEETWGPPKTDETIVFEVVPQPEFDSDLDLI